MFGMVLGRQNKKIKREIIVNSEALETRVAVMEDERLEEFQVEHPTEERIVGSIYKGRIQNLESGLQAAFVDIGLKKNAFLHYWDMIPEDAARLEAIEEREIPGRSSQKRGKVSPAEIEKMFPSGTEIVVQVTKGPIGAKGPRVTANLSIPGRYLVMLPGCKLKGVSKRIEDAKERQRLKKILTRLPLPENMGVIVRTAAEGARQRSFVHDLRGLIAVHEQINQGMKERRAPCNLYAEPELAERVVRDWLTEDVDRIVVDDPECFERIRELAAIISRRTRSRIQLYDGQSPVFEHFNIERQIGDAFRRKVALASGGCIVFDETEAMVTIDVNTGRHKGASTQEAAILEVNLEAVKEIARQLRLRNIGGLLVIDLIDMRLKKNRMQVLRLMKQELVRDKARTNVLPISSLGLMEMTRQRSDEGVLSGMYVDCSYCKGRGSVKSPLSISVDMQRQMAAAFRRHARRKEPLQMQIIVHPTVLERLRERDEDALVDLQKRFSGRLSFRADPNRHVEDFMILNATDNDVLYKTPERS